MIEEFMLLANKKVAEFIGKQKKTFIYRIHDEPNADKLVALQTVIAKFGYKIDLRSKDDISKSLNSLLVKSSVERTKFSGYSDYQNDE
jgi:ribonuclease R